MSNQLSQSDWNESGDFHKKCPLVTCLSHEMEHQSEACICREFV